MPAMDFPFVPASGRQDLIPQAIRLIILWLSPPGFHPRFRKFATVGAEAVGIMPFGQMPPFSSIMAVWRVAEGDSAVL